MADITGPISSLPGARHRVPTGATCDCCGVPATIRIQGETDSFGCELNDYCQACYDKMEARIAAEREADPDAGNYICDGCKRDAPCKPARDLEEGNCGPVYWYCDPCMSRHHEQQRAAFADDVDDHQDYWGEDDDDVY